MSDGFLGRWSRRKNDVREGKPVVEPVPPAAVPVAVAAAAPVSPAVAPEAAAEPPPPTLEDTRALTPASDFKPFMAQDVSADVRNAAVKKLFADPHFNVMDRLDIYIDDYSQPDPLPAAMLRQMASAKFLNLFDEAEKAPMPLAPDAQAMAPNTPTAGDDADTAPEQGVAQSLSPSESPALPVDVQSPDNALTPTEDAHTDLRLQPDHAPQRESAGPGPA